MAITWEDEVCKFVVEDDVPGGKMKPDKMLEAINAATVTLDATHINTEENPGTGKTDASVYFPSIPDATDKAATESTITGTPYTPERPWASARRILREIFLSSSGQVQTDRIMDSLDERASWMFALDAGNYTSCLAVLNDEIGKSLIQEDYDLIVSKFPDPV